MRWKVFILGMALAVSASADTTLRLVMVDGSIIRGTLIGNDSQVLTLEVHGKAKEIPIDGVRKAFDASTNMPYTFVTNVQPAPVVQSPEHGATPVTAAPEAPVEEDQAPIIHRRHRIKQDRGPNVLDKSWYLYNGVGVASFRYPGEIQGIVDSTLSGQSDVTRLGMSLELLGFYYSFRPHNLLLGIICDVSGDAYRIDHTTPFDISEALYAVSAMYFLGQGVGRGLFLRVDAGYAQFEADFDSSTVLAAHDGIGMVLGVGYAFPIARKFSIMVTLDDMWLKMQDQIYESPRLNLGVMF